MIATTKDCYHRLYLFYGQRDLLLLTTHSFSKKLKSAIKSKAISVQFQPKVQFNFNLASDSDSISASSYLPNYPTQLPPYQPTILPIYGPTNQPTNLPTYQPIELPAKLPHPTTYLWTYDSRQADSLTFTESHSFYLWFKLFIGHTSKDLLWSSTSRLKF